MLLRSYLLLRERVYRAFVYKRPLFFSYLTVVAQKRLYNIISCIIIKITYLTQEKIPPERTVPYSRLLDSKFSLSRLETVDLRVPAGCIREFSVECLLSSVAVLCNCTS
jgi:hypothetical protein